MPGCIAFGQGHTLIAACQAGIVRLHLDDGRIERLIDPPYQSERMRFNDGRCDPAGRLWVGSYSMDHRKPGQGGLGAFYSYDGETLRAVISPITTANGSAFSADGRRMFRVESPRREIYVSDFDAEAGDVADERLFARVPTEFGVPDGAAVDTEGGYWVALPMGPSGGAVIRFDPAGRIERVVQLPVLMPTMVAFGGPSLSTLFITSASDPQFDSRPLGELAGAVFALEVPFTGIAEPVCRF